MPVILSIYVQTSPAYLFTLLYYTNQLSLKLANSTLYNKMKLNSVLATSLLAAVATADCSP